MFPVAKVIRILETANRQWPRPVVGAYGRDPFKVLISCLLSLRTKDETTAPASRRLFAAADNPVAMARLPVRTIERLIYPVGFYRVKAQTLRTVSAALLERYGGQVPRHIEELVTLHGVGRKTANLVVTAGYNLPGICVDTHVHRISNRWGLVRTNNPDQTETALRKTLPQKFWIRFNELLVTFGQNQCKPVSPLCSTCPLRRSCPRNGVANSR